MSEQRWAERQRRMAELGATLDADARRGQLGVALLGVFAGAGVRRGEPRA